MARSATTHASVTRELGILASPLIIWALHFTTLYGANTLGCLSGNNATIKLSVLVATIIALGLLVLNFKHFGSRGNQVGRSILLVSSIISLFAIVCSAGAIAFLDACTTAR